MSKTFRNTGRGYKSFRLTFSNPVLVDAVDEIQQETGMAESDLAEEAIIKFLEEEGKITR